MEIESISRVANNAMPIARFFVEAMGHSVGAVVQSEKPAVHQARCFGSKNPDVAHLSILQMSDDEARHVSRATAHAAGRKRTYCFKGLGRIGPQLITIRH